MNVPTITLSGSALTGIMPHLLTMEAQAALPSQVRLGRLRPAVLPTVQRLSKYIDTERMATPPPTAINRRDKAAAALAHMYLNDRYGCCVVSGKGHAFGVWSANDSDSGGTVIATDAEIYSQYQSWCGPGDNGCYITKVLDVIKAKGMLLGGKSYKIEGYVAADWTNQLEVQVAQYLFGATTIGLNLPSAWQSSAIWDVTNTPIVGGHDVTPIDYDQQGVYVSSWGRVYLITWRAFMARTWLEEYYVLLAPLWYGNDKLAPCGVDAVTLRADLAMIGQGQIPNIDPTPVPPPPPGGTAPIPTSGQYLIEQTTGGLWKLTFGKQAQ